MPAGFAAAAAGLTGFRERNLPDDETFSGCLTVNSSELLMSTTNAEAGMRDWTDKATRERLEKDVAAVKSDIAALTDQITDALNTFANSSSKQARRGYSQARENVDSAIDDMSERGSAMMGAAQEGLRLDRGDAGGRDHAAAARDRRARARHRLPDRRGLAPLRSRTDIKTVAQRRRRCRLVGI